MGYSSSSPCKDLEKVLQDLSSMHSIWDVFQDWLAVSAIAISNAVDWNQKEYREKIYMELIAKYNKQEQEQLAEALGILVLTLQKELELSGPTDVLGQVFHALELHNKYRGQFFTPPHICEMMGQLVLGSKDAGNLNKELETKGYFTVCEPCIGSGGMILGLAKAMSSQHLDYRRQMLVTGVDIDMKCVYMAYLQLSLLGIPAVIIHGNSITMEEWSRWYTPAYMLDMWSLWEHIPMFSDVCAAAKEAQRA